MMQLLKQVKVKNEGLESTSRFAFLIRKRLLVAKSKSRLYSSLKEKI